MENPIDFVVIWVDGGDQVWQAEKNRYLELDAGRSAAIDAGENRYRDWDNLKYWFRGVDKYAPWVNRVHFVTCGQVPEWLNLGAPKLHFVRHSDYIPGEYLPTFSANPIELNLHRIPGLCEQFVFFNDDFFLTAPVRPEDFFVNGLPCDSLAEQPFEFPRAELFNNILINDIAFVNRHFDRRSARRQHPGKWYSAASAHDSMKNILLAGLRNRYFFGLAYDHLPQPFLKRTFRDVWQTEPKLLAETCTHRFRDERDVNQYIFKYWQLLSGNFRPYDRRKAGKAFSGSWNPSEVAAIILSGKCKMICINDSNVQDFSAAKQVVNKAFAETLKEKSSFER